ncbi:unannotated protein [freshwater metagenome]|uniref:Unannotated protein n=1 Tax=freshwater metagenome TaxID=449393 RepID=A0A6J6PZA7_9ZZZZ
MVIVVFGGSAAAITVASRVDSPPGVSGAPGQLSVRRVTSDSPH